MRAALILLAALGSATAVAALGAATAVAAPRPAHRATDWTRIVVDTPDGGTRIGNPAAKAKLVEYGSFTCTHCGAFAKEGFKPLIERYVATGRLSFEFRPALRDKADYVAALTARCAGPQRYFPLAEALFGAQQDWFERAAQADEAAPADVNAADPAPAIGGLADRSGMAAIAAKQGIARPALQRCFADKAARDAVQKAAEDAWNVRKIDGTPAFFLNGDRLSGIYGWAALEPQLRAATHG